ncbi:hypothetical protein ABG768_001224, partial [Culter alburnus]
LNVVVILYILCCLESLVICLFCSIFSLMAKMNQSRPHDRRKACDVDLSEPVYVNVSRDMKRP